MLFGSLPLTLNLVTSVGTSPDPPGGTFQWATWIPNIALPILGIAIIIFCIGSFFFPFGQRFKDTKQVLRGFGVDLEISVLTVFLLLGSAMVCAGLFLYMRSTDVVTLSHEIEKLQGKLNAAHENLEKVGRFTIVANLQFPANADVDLEHLENLECWYYLDPKIENKLTVNVMNGIGPKSVKVKLPDMSPNDVIWRLEVREHKSSRLVGVLTNTYPLGPTYELKP